MQGLGASPTMSSGCMAQRARCIWTWTPRGSALPFKTRVSLCFTTSTFTCFLKQIRHGLAWIPSDHRNCYTLPVVEFCWWTRTVWFCDYPILAVHLFLWAKSVILEEYSVPVVELMDILSPDVALTLCTTFTSTLKQMHTTYQMLPVIWVVVIYSVCVEHNWGILIYVIAYQQMSVPRSAGGRFEEVKVASDKEGHWRVEEEFIAAIRGTEKVCRTSFAQGVRYMEFTQAVATSYQTGNAVMLPFTQHWI